jgi:ABC-2 type transport system permease protein
MAAGWLSPATRAVLAHEWRSALRGIADMAGTAGPTRPLRLVLALALMAAIAFGVSHLLLLNAGALDPADPVMRITLTINLVFLFVLMVSAALDSAAYALYAKGDYDLLFSAPLSPRAVLLVRALNVLGFTVAKATLYGGPILILLAMQRGPHWLAGLPLILALALAATAFAVALAMAMVRLVGVGRTRVVAQVTAALAGLSVLVMVQWDAIFGPGPRQAIAAAYVAGQDSWGWWMATMPARALTGDLPALVLTGLGTVVFAALAFNGLADSFVRNAVLAAGDTAPVKARPRRSHSSFGSSAFAALMLKERRLILRDPWLMSQILMQCIFLIPVAVVTVWRVLTGTHGADALAPVLVVLTGQIAGGLTWIALSADEAAELAQTAPINARLRQQARFAAIAWLAAVFITPPLALILWFDPWTGLVSLIGIFAAIICGILVNLWHQPRLARTGLIRRRQKSPITVTIMELAALTMVAVAVWPLLSAEYAMAGLGAVAAAVTMGALYVARRREAAAT